MLINLFRLLEYSERILSLICALIINLGNVGVLGPRPLNVLGIYYSKLALVFNCSYARHAVTLFPFFQKREAREKKAYCLRMTIPW